MVRYEFSKDLKTWTSQIDGVDIHTRIEVGSYKRIEGYKLFDKPLTNSIEFNLVGTSEFRLEMMNWTYCRVFKDNGGEPAFTGHFTGDSQGVVEMIGQLAFTMKYVDFYDYISGYESTEEKELIEDSRDIFNTTGGSLFHTLTEPALKASEVPLTLSYEEGLATVPGPVRYYKFSEGDNLVEKAMEILSECGLFAYILNSSLYICDISSSKEGNELFDIEADAQIKHSEWVDTRVPPISVVGTRTMTTSEFGKDQQVLNNKSYSFFPDREELFNMFKLYYDTGIIDSVEVVDARWSNDKPTWSLHLIDTVPKNAEDGKKVYIKDLIDVITSDVDTAFEALFGRVSYWVNAKWHLKWWHWQESFFCKLKFQIKYAFNFQDETNNDSELEPISPNTTYTPEQAKRYYIWLKTSKKQEQEEWIFYHKEKLKINDVVRINGVEGSTVIISQIEDTDDEFGGYTYHAYPYVGDITDWNEIDPPKTEIEVPPPPYYPVTLREDKPLQVRDGKFINNPIRYWIDCDNPEYTPKVTLDGQSIEVKQDFPEGESTELSDLNGHTFDWYFDYEYTDPNRESYTFVVTWGPAENTYTYVPLRLDTPKYLSISLSSSLFALDRDGKAYPDQVIHVKAQATGLKTAVQWLLSNGRGIPEGTLEFDVYPEDLSGPNKDLLSITVKADGLEDSIEIRGIRDGQQGNSQQVSILSDIDSYTFYRQNNGLIKPEDYEAFQVTFTVSQDNQKFTGVNGPTLANGQFYLELPGGTGITGLTNAGNVVKGTANTIMFGDSVRVKVVVQYQDWNGVRGNDTYYVTLFAKPLSSLNALLQVSANEFKFKKDGTAIPNQITVKVADSYTGSDLNWALTFVKSDGTAETPRKINPGTREFTLSSQEMANYETLKIELQVDSVTEVANITKSLLVSYVENEFTGLHSEIEQTADKIAFWVDTDGKVYTQAGIEIGTVEKDGEKEGYILLKADNIIAEGTLTAKEVNADRFFTDSFGMNQEGIIRSIKPDGTYYEEGDIANEAIQRGFYIRGDGYAEFAWMKIRGVYAVGEFESASFKAVNGLPNIEKEQIQAEYQADFEQMKSRVEYTPRVENIGNTLEFDKLSQITPAALPAADFMNVGRFRDEENHAAYNLGIYPINDADNIYCSPLFLTVENNKVKITFHKYSLQEDATFVYVDSISTEIYTLTRALEGNISRKIKTSYMATEMGAKDIYLALDLDVFAHLFTLEAHSGGISFIQNITESTPSIADVASISMHIIDSIPFAIAYMLFVSKNGNHITFNCPAGGTSGIYSNLSGSNARWPEGFETISSFLYQDLDKGIKPLLLGIDSEELNYLIWDVTKREAYELRIFNTVEWLNSNIDGQILKPDSDNNLTLGLTSYLVGTAKTTRSIIYNLKEEQVEPPTITINTDTAQATITSADYSQGYSTTDGNWTSVNEIRYTTDGSNPTSSSTLYAGPFTVTDGMTIKAIQIATGYLNSLIVTQEVQLKEKSPKPIITRRGNKLLAGYKFPEHVLTAVQHFNTPNILELWITFEKSNIDYANTALKFTPVSIDNTIIFVSALPEPVWNERLEAYVISWDIRNSAPTTGQLLDYKLQLDYENYPEESYIRLISLGFIDE